MKSIILKILSVILLASALSVSAAETPKSTRAERRAIMEGNALVKEGKFAEAVKKYRVALVDNPQSAVAKFNLGLSQINLSKATQQNDSVSQKLLAEGVEAMQSAHRPTEEAGPGQEQG